MQETPVQFLGQEDPLDRDRLPTPVFLGFACGSTGKESACNAGDPSSIPGLERSPGEGIGYPLQYSLGFPGDSDSKKKTTCNVGDPGLIPKLGRSPGGGHGNPLQYSYLENPHGQKSLAGYSPRGGKESDMTEQLHLLTSLTHLYY